MLSPVWSVFRMYGLRLTFPSSYSYAVEGHVCRSAVMENQVLSYRVPTNKGLEWDQGSVVTVTAASRAIVEADGVPIWWQSSDAAFLAAASTRSESMASTPKGSSRTDISSSVSSSLLNLPPLSVGRTTSSPRSSGGLTQEGKLGIGVGVGLGIPFAVVIGLAVGYFLFGTRKRNSSIHRFHGVGSALAPYDGEGRLEPKELGDTPGPGELNHTREPGELDHTREPGELEHTRVFPELASQDV